MRELIKGGFKIRKDGVEYRKGKYKWLRRAAADLNCIIEKVEM